MENGFTFKDALLDVFNSLAVSVAEFVPRALTALVIILVGIVVAKIVEKMLRTAFDRLRIDSLLSKIGVTDSLRRIGLQGTPGRLISRAIYFLLIILFTQSVTRAVGLETIANAIGSFFSYLPNLVAAFLVLLFGTMAAQAVARAVTRSAEGAGIEYAPAMGRAVSALILFVVGIMAISQLRIDTGIVRQVVLVTLIGFSAALALSFGLGTRDVTRNLVAGFYARKLFQAGQSIELHGERGTLTAITPIQTLIDKKGTSVSVPNSVFLDEVVRQ